MFKITDLLHIGEVFSTSNDEITLLHSIGISESLPFGISEFSPPGVLHFEKKLAIPIHGRKILLFYQTTIQQ